MTFDPSHIQAWQICSYVHIDHATGNSVVHDLQIAAVKRPDDLVGGFWWYVEFWDMTEPTLDASIRICTLDPGKDCIWTGPIRFTFAPIDRVKLWKGTGHTPPIPGRAGAYVLQLLIGGEVVRERRFHIVVLERSSDPAT